MSLHRKQWLTAALGLGAAAAAPFAFPALGTALGIGGETAGAGLLGGTIGEVAPTVATDVAMDAVPQVGTEGLLGTVGSTVPAETALEAAPHFGGLANIPDYMAQSPGLLGETAMLQPPQMGSTPSFMDKMGDFANSKGVKFARAVNAGMGQQPQNQTRTISAPPQDSMAQKRADMQAQILAAQTGQDAEAIKRRMQPFSLLFTG